MKPRVPASKYKQFIAFVDFLESNNATQFFEFLERDVFYEDPEWWIVKAFKWYKSEKEDFCFSINIKWQAIITRKIIQEWLDLVRENSDAN